MGGSILNFSTVLTSTRHHGVPEPSYPSGVLSLPRTVLASSSHWLEAAKGDDLCRIWLTMCLIYLKFDKGVDLNYFHHRKKVFM